jgi:hypothetical protein
MLLPPTQKKRSSSIGFYSQKGKKSECRSDRPDGRRRSHCNSEKQRVKSSEEIHGESADAIVAYLYLDESDDECPRVATSC